MGETILDVQSTLAAIQAKVIDLVEKSKGDAELFRQAAVITTRRLLPLVYSDSPEIGRAAAYALLSSSPKLNLGLDPMKAPNTLSDEENEKFYNGVVELLKASDVVCVATTDAKATDEIIDGHKVVEVSFNATRVMPFTIGGRKITISDHLLQGEDDADIGCSIANKFISREVTQGAPGEDVIFSLTAKFGFAHDAVPKKVPIHVITSFLNSHQRVPVSP